MSKAVNKMVFDINNAEEKKSCYELIEFLTTFGQKSESDYCDIHIYNEECFIIVEWTQIPYDGAYGGKFAYVDEDECIFKEVRLPDNTIEYAPDEEIAKEILDRWKVENPGYETNNI